MHFFVVENFMLHFKVLMELVPCGCIKRLNPLFNHTTPPMIHQWVHRWWCRPRRTRISCIDWQQAAGGIHAVGSNFYFI